MIRFAVIGTNWITRQFVDAAHETGKLKLTAVYSRSLEQAQSFANDYLVEHLFTSLDEMAQSDAIDAVYIASPNSLHFPQTKLFLSHKKHVICEKPLASNIQEVEAAIALARENQVVLFEAFKTASLPNFLLLQQSLPKIGKVRKAFINYCQYSSRYQRYLDGENPNTFNPAFSNGSIMDIGFLLPGLCNRAVGRAARRHGHGQPAGKRCGCARGRGAGLRRFQRHAAAL
jgi:predicted dehydrogenase